jgi:hypothetical protein
MKWIDHIWMVQIFLMYTSDVMSISMATWIFVTLW